MVYSRSVITAILAASAVSSVLAVPVPGSTSTTSAVAPPATALSRRDPPNPPVDGPPVDGAPKDEGKQPPAVDVQSGGEGAGVEHPHHRKHPKKPEGGVVKKPENQDQGVGKRDFHEHHRHHHEAEEEAELLEEAVRRVHHAEHHLEAAEKHLHHLFHAEDEGEFVSKHRIHEAKERLRKAEHRLHHAEKHLHHLEEEIDDGDFHPHHHHGHHEHHFRLGHAAAHRYSEHKEAPVLKIALETRALPGEKGAVTGERKKHLGDGQGDGASSGLQAEMSAEEKTLRAQRKEAEEAHTAKLEGEELREAKEEIRKQHEELERQQDKVKWLKEHPYKPKGGARGGEGALKPHHKDAAATHKGHTGNSEDGLKRRGDSETFLTARSPKGGQEEGGKKTKKPLTEASVTAKFKKLNPSAKETEEFNKKATLEEKLKYVKHLKHERKQAAGAGAGAGAGGKEPGPKKGSDEEPSSDAESKGAQAAVEARSLSDFYGADLD